MMPSKRIERERLLEALKMLGKELMKLGCTGEILLTGGAAMCIVHEARKNTRDIDALYSPKPEIDKIAKAIAKDFDLPENWLNDDVKMFLHQDPPKEVFRVLDGLAIQVVSAEYLLAMKLTASRPHTEDMNDVVFLFNKLNLKSKAQAEKLLAPFFFSDHFPSEIGHIVDLVLQQFNPDIN
jgi:hypothetical protein